MNPIANQFTSLEYINANYPKSEESKRVSGSAAEVSFSEVLQSKKQVYDKPEVAFSKHANQRLQLRNMKLSDEQMDRLNYGVEQARQKNIRESLIFVDNMAFIVNIPNNTVVTAMNGEDEQKVFTNIDGAVIS